jgi:hypothetical protein
MLTPREQGDIGELSAMHWLASKGAYIWLPVSNHPDCDLIAELDGRLLRVQAKTSTCFYKRRWSVTICTRGGNQSWNGLVKRLDATRCDFVFVLVRDGRRWFIPADRLGGTTAVQLGGPKYAEFEVEPGDPIPHTRGAGAPLQSAIPPIRGDVRAAKGNRL